MSPPAEVALQLRRVVDDIRAMVQSAAWHAANLMIYKTRTQKAQQAHKAAGEAAKFESQADLIALQLPDDLAFHLKWLAWNAAWHAANYLAENNADAASALRAFEKHAKRTEELLPAELADNFKWMAWNAAWHAANTRSNLPDDAEEHRKLFETHAAALAPWRLRSWCKTPPRPDPPFRGVNLVLAAHSPTADPTCTLPPAPLTLPPAPPHLPPHPKCFLVRMQGGLLLCERWMQHGLFSPFPAAADEARLALSASRAIAARAVRGGGVGGVARQPVAREKRN